MKRSAIALLATTMIGMPFAMAATNNQQQPPQGQQMQQNQGQAQQQGDQSRQQNDQQQAAQVKQSVAPQNLSRSEIRQVQQALDKDGFNAGPKDGRWGRETESAVKQFQQSKQLQATGQLDQQTLADLGLDASRFTQSQGNQK